MSPPGARANETNARDLESRELPLPPAEPADRQRAAAQRQEAEELARLMESAARGDEHSFAAVYERTSARVYGLALRILRSPEHAAEVVQEVFVEVWEQARRYDARTGTVFAWIITMAHRRAIDRLRSESAAVGRDTQRDAQRDVRREIDQVWAAVEQRFGSRRVGEGMKALTQIQRQALLLAYFEGYNQQEIADDLGVPLGAVKTRMRDGLLNLRRALGVDEDG